MNRFITWSKIEMGRLEGEVKGKGACAAGRIGEGGCKKREERRRKNIKVLEG